MKHYAQIEGGLVVRLVSLDEPLAVADAAPSLVDPIECPAEVVPGWHYDGATFSPPPPPEVTAADLVAYAATLRWQREVGGITVGGIPIATDDRSKVLIAGARIAAGADPAWTTTWFAADNTAHVIDASTIVAISDAVAGHISACFATFAALAAEIEAGAVTTRAGIEAAFAA